MIEIRVWDTKTKEYLDLCKAIINDVSVCHTRCGYEVLINLKTKVYNIEGFGGVQGGGQKRKDSIIFEKDDVWHTVEWEEPPALRIDYVDNMTMFHQVDKSQVIISFIHSDMLCQKGENMACWECPSQGMMDMLDKLELETY